MTDFLPWLMAQRRRSGPVGDLARSMSPAGLRHLAPPQQAVPPPPVGLTAADLHATWRARGYGQDVLDVLDLAAAEHAAVIAAARIPGGGA